MEKCKAELKDIQQKGGRATMEEREVVVLKMKKLQADAAALEPRIEKARSVTPTPATRALFDTMEGGGNSVRYTSSSKICQIIPARTVRCEEKFKSYFGHSLPRRQ